MADIAVTGVSLDLENMFLMKNETQQLVATVSPADATNKNVTWSSSNNEVATVATDGKVTAKIDNGNCTITATTEDGGFTANCNIVVSSEATSIVLDRVLVKMEENSNITLNYYTQPEGSYLPNPVVWSSSNTEIATVDEYGTVTTNTNHGETTIIVSSGSLSDSCIVKVATMPTNITILEDRITQEIINININELPNEIKTGDIIKKINGKYFIDEEETRTIEKRIEDKMNDLWN